MLTQMYEISGGHSKVFIMNDILEKSGCTRKLHVVCEHDNWRV